MIKQNKPQVLVAHLGARMHYAVPTILHKNDYLSQMFTDVYVGKGSKAHFFAQYMPEVLLQVKGINRFVQRKAELPENKVTAFNLMGMQFAWQLYQATRNPEIIPQIFYDQSRIFLEKILATPHWLNASAIYGFTRSSLELFEAASHQKKYVEQMIAPVSEMERQLAKARDMHENWIDQNHSVFFSWPQVAGECERKEWALADAIIAPSPYVRSTLLDQGVPEEKIKVIPYAISLNNYKGTVHSFDGTRPLRILFVGTVGLRKGVPDLLQALKLLGPDKVSARLVGHIELPKNRLEQYEDVAECLGLVARDEVRKHYDWADLFVLPSICEGSATVIYEAMASGLPIVATFNSGAWINEGEHGFYCQVFDAEHLAQIIENFLINPSLVNEMSRAVLQNVLQYSWEKYEQRLCELILNDNEMLID